MGRATRVSKVEHSVEESAKDVAGTPSSSGIRWNFAIVSLLCGVSGLGRKSRATTLARESLEQELRKNTAFKVITKSDISAKGKDAKSLASSFRSILKQDCARGVNLKKKISHELPRMFSVKFTNLQTAKDDDSDSSDDNGPGTVEPESHTPALNSTNPETSNETELSRLDNENVDPLIMQDIGIGPDTVYNVEDIEAARAVLTLDPALGDPDCVFVLLDYPENEEELAALMTLNPNESLIDAIVELKDDMNGGDEGGASHVQSTDATPGENEGGTQTTPAEDSNSVPREGKQDENESSSRRFAMQSQTSLRAMRKTTSRIALREAISAPSLEGKTVRPQDIVGRLKRTSREMKGSDRKGLLFLTLDIFGNSGCASLSNGDDSKWAPLLESWKNLCRNLGVEKYRFSKYLASCKSVKIPQLTGPVENLPKLLTEYNDQNSGIPEFLMSVSIVVDSMARAVAICGGQTSSLSCSASQEQPLHGMPEDCQVQLVHSRDRSLTRVCRGAKRAVHSDWSEDLVDSELEGSGSQGEVATRVMAIERKLHRLTKFPGGRGRWRMPVKPHWSVERQRVEHSQFKTFAKLPTEVVNYVNHVLHLEQLVYARDPSQRNHWNFRDREYMEYLSPEVMDQEIVNIQQDESDLVYEYHQETDNVVLAVHQHVPQGRRYTVPRSALLHTSVRPTFGDWPQLSLTTQPVVYDVDINQLRELEGQTEFLFPCDDSVVRVEQRKTGIAWVSVLKDNHLFGLRASDPARKQSAQSRSARFRADFNVSFDDESHASVEQGPSSFGKPDGCGTVTMGYGSTDGLLVRVCSDGSIWQALVTSSREGQVPAAMEECSRTIVGLGTVVRQLRDGRVQILFANGAIAESIVEESPSPDPQQESRPNSSSGNMNSSRGGTSTRSSLVHDSGVESNDSNTLEGENKSKFGSIAADFLLHKGRHTKRWKITCFTEENGAVEYQQAGISRSNTTVGGRSFKSRSGKESLKGKTVAMENLKSVATDISLDPETNCLKIVRLSDGVQLLRDPLGQTTITHADGTIISTRWIDGVPPLTKQEQEEAAAALLSSDFLNSTELPKRRKSSDTLITVEAPGFSSVTINKGTETSAKCHSQGGRVEISSGGRKTRSTTTTPDGTIIKIDYDTRITATVNGFVNLIKDDGTQIDAQDSGLVLYGPASNIALASKLSTIVPQIHKAGETPEMDEPQTSLGEESTDNIQALQVNGLFRFDCEAGSMEMVDFENNIFQVRGAVSSRQQVTELNLSGAVQNLCPVVNHPMQPRLFVLPGDGSAVEILTNASVESFLRLAHAKPRYQHRVSRQVHTPIFRLPTDPNSRFHHFLYELTRGGHATTINGKQEQNAVTTSQQMVLMQRSLLQREPIGQYLLSQLQASFEKFVAWKAHVESAEDRYAVLDNRSPTEHRNEIAIQRKIMKERRRLRKLEAKRLRRGSKSNAASIIEEPADIAANIVSEEEEPNNSRIQRNGKPTLDHGFSTRTCNMLDGFGLEDGDRLSTRSREMANSPRSNDEAAQPPPEEYWRVAYPLHPNCTTANYWQHKARVGESKDEYAENSTEMESATKDTHAQNGEEMESITTTTA